MIRGVDENGIVREILVDTDGALIVEFV